MLVLDARDVTDRRAALEAVQAQSPRTVVVVFAEDAIKVQRAAALKGTRLFAVLPPKSSRRLIDYSTTHSNTDGTKLTWFRRILVTQRITWIRRC